MTKNYAKIEITGYLHIKTGLHIGTSGAFSAIGAVDSPVVRDPLARQPMIPGSSLKGKMRTLLARQYNEEWKSTPENDNEMILRLFGKGRLLFSDMLLINEKQLKEKGADTTTEVKFENTINRITSEATPRQIERVIRGAVFGLSIVYEVAGQDTSEIEEDFTIIRDGFVLLGYDYLGGSGSRGYGKVAFSMLKAKVVVGTLEVGIEETINEKLGEVRNV